MESLSLHLAWIAGILFCKNAVSALGIALHLIILIGNSNPSKMSFRIYLYNVLQLEQGPVKTFSGCRIDSFFVKVRDGYFLVLTI